MNLKRHGSGSFGPVFQGNVMKKKKEPNLFLREKPLEDMKYLGVGFFEWFAVLGALGMILGSILKNYF